MDIGPDLLLIMSRVL